MPTCDCELRINGVPSTIAAGDSADLPDGGQITFSGARYTVVSSKSGPVAVVTIGGYYLNVGVGRPYDSAPASGLLGNDDGEPHNDIAVRNGEVLAHPITFRDLYGVFGESWRVTPAESLFDYEPGESTETFVDRTFPPFQMSLAYVPFGPRQTAEEVCRNAGVAEGYWLDSCVIDVAVTGDPSFADGLAGEPPPTVTLEVIEDAEAMARGAAWASEMSDTDDSESPSNEPAAFDDESSGCGCSTPGSWGGRPWMLAALAALGGLHRIRQRRQKHGGAV